MDDKAADQGMLMQRLFCFYKEQKEVEIWECACSYIGNKFLIQGTGYLYKELSLTGEERVERDRNDNTSKITCH